VPCIEDCTMDLARDLELPGLPTRKRGILNSIQIAIMNTFSRRAAFLAIFGPRVMLSSSTSWQLWGKDGDVDVTTCFDVRHGVMRCMLPLDFIPELCCSPRQSQRSHKLGSHTLLKVLPLLQSGVVADTDGQEKRVSDGIRRAWECINLSEEKGRGLQYQR